MPDITVTFSVDESVDPTREDPLDIAERVIDVHNEWARTNGRYEDLVAIDSLSAEWA